MASWQALHPNEAPAGMMVQSAFYRDDAQRSGLLRGVGRILLFGFLRLGFADFTVRSFLAFGQGVFLCIGRQMYGLPCFASSNVWGGAKWCIVPLSRKHDVVERTVQLLPLDRRQRFSSFQ
jgi:hypothetical protein